DRLDLAVRILEAGVLVRLVCRLDDHVLRVLVPVLAELGAAHADDGDLVADGVRVHDAPKLRPCSRYCNSERQRAASPASSTRGGPTTAAPPHLGIALAWDGAHTGLALHDVTGTTVGRRARGGGEAKMGLDEAFDAIAWRLARQAVDVVRSRPRQL